MKKFSFSLEKILKLRSHAENNAKIELGRAVSALSRIENRLLDIAASQKTAAGNRFSGGNDLPRLVAHENYMQRLEAEEERLLKDAAAASLEVEQARGLWVEARSGLKVMENLKERKLAAYRKESRREE
jgi:flagellar export protein FliJ